VNRVLVTLILFLPLVFGNPDVPPIPGSSPLPTPTLIPTPTPTQAPTPTPTSTPIPPLPALGKGTAGIRGGCDYAMGDWYYNWGPEGTGCPDQIHIPTIRDADQWEQIKSGEKSLDAEIVIILGFNEPDGMEPAGCDLTPTEAVPLMREIYTAYPDLLHVAPSPSQYGIWWVYNARRLYIQEYGEPPPWSYLGVHCYFYDQSTLNQCKSVIRQFETWAVAWGIPGGLILTEFAAGAISGDYDTAVTLADSFLTWAEPKMSGYSWFTARDIGCWPPHVSTYLFDEDGMMTPFGVWYEAFGE